MTNKKFLKQIGVGDVIIITVFMGIVGYVFGGFLIGMVLAINSSNSPATTFANYVTDYILSFMTEGKKESYGFLVPVYSKILFFAIIIFVVSILLPKRTLDRNNRTDSKKEDKTII